jgi:AbrB family looped-hinge helix DNA binding protein
MTYFARVTERGEIVLPADVAQAIGLNPGDRFRIDQQGLDILLQTDGDVVASGRQAYMATIKRPFTVDDFLADRRADAQR